MIGHVKAMSQGRAPLERKVSSDEQRLVPRTRNPDAITFEFATLIKNEVETSSK